MNATRALRAAHGYVPLIKFKGHHVPPASIDHTPQVHPASTKPLPDSFASYRQKSQQHGPLAGHKAAPSLSGGNKIAYGAVGGTAGRQLGDVEAPKGMFFDRSELPQRFRRMEWSQAEIEAVESAGASMW